MNSRSGVVRMAALLFFIPLAIAEAGLNFSGSFQTDSGTGATIRVVSPYGKLPPGGYAPFEVTIKNDADTSRTWRFNSNAKGRRMRTLSAWDFTVPPETTRSFRMLVPLPSLNGRGSSHLNLNLSGSGPGLHQANANGYVSLSHNATDFVGMSESLHIDYWGKLAQAVEKGNTKSSGLKLEGFEVDLDLLVPDWRSYAGLSELWMKTSEWRALSATVRSAIESWVLFGGTLLLVRDSQTPTPVLDFTGLGDVVFLEEGPTFLSDATAHLQQRDGSIASATAPAGDTWEALTRVFGPLQPPMFLVLVFVLLFGIAIGPINFFVLAPPGKRARLFWTTPVISLAATLLMFGFIVLLDGFGGSGVRTTLLISAPEQQQIALQQVQVARTGLLTSNGFVTPVPAFISQISLSSDNSSTRSEMSGD